jgi:NADH-quinone oxidoreductase subunit G
MEMAAQRLAAIRKDSGPDSIGFYGSNRTTNEESYLLNRIARAAIGTNNLDHHHTADYAGLMQMAASLPAENAAASLATIGELASAPAFLLLGNDASEQNPLVAWQIRAAIRHFGSRLYVMDSQRTKIMRKATNAVVLAPGQEVAAVASLVGDANGSYGKELQASLKSLREALSGENELIVLFGAAFQGSGLDNLAKLARARAAEGKRTRFIALGDYANSRGAADMGVLSDMLPGYAPLSDASSRNAYSQLWGATVPDKPGLSADGMMQAAISGSLHALYVVGANPLKGQQVNAQQGTPSGRLGKLEFLIVQDLFLSETAQLADIVLPALSAYEKDGTMTNTAGEIQLVRKGGDFMGPRSDFDILRILSHQLARQGVGQPIRLRTPEAAFEEIRANVRGYDVSWTGLLTGNAEVSAPQVARNGHAPHSSPPAKIESNVDSLFTSGSLTQYCRMIQSLREADAKPLHEADLKPQREADLKQ